jgi:hypothetical protein
MRASVSSTPVTIPRQLIIFFSPVTHSSNYTHCDRVPRVVLEDYNGWHNDFVGWARSASSLAQDPACLFCPVVLFACRSRHMMDISQRWTSLHQKSAKN